MSNISGHEWIARFAGALGVAVPDPSTLDRLLELAGVAAHRSERLAAPIACYLAGLAGADPAQALALAEMLDLPA